MVKKYLLLSVAAVLLAGAIAAYLPETLPPPATRSLTEDRTARRDFALTDTAGQKVNLATYQGQWLLIFFGFTHCPDICPTALLNVTATLQELGPAADHVRPLFITVDPARDTINVMRDYLANFDSRIVGLVGTPAETASVAKQYGVFFQKRDATNDDYMMDHSTAFYLVAPDGTYVRPYAPDLDPAAFARDLNAAMSKLKE